LRLHAAGEFPAARQRYRELIDVPELTAACLHQLALIAAQRSDFTAAVALLRHSLRVDSSHLDTYTNLAIALRRSGQPGAALSVLLDQGCLLQNAGRFQDAEIPFRAILAEDPLNYGAYVNLGTCLARQHRLPEAIQQIFSALRLYARLDRAVANFLALLTDRLSGKLELLPALPLPSGLPTGRIEKIEDAITTLGKLMSENRLPDEAVLCHQQSVEIAPGFALAHWNLSLALLAVGRHAEGWREYEWRWHWDGFPERRRQLPIAPWRGEPLEGKRILVWAEQGFGDTMQFAPLLSRLVGMGAAVTFEVQASLARLFAASLDGVNVVGSPDPSRTPLLVVDFDYCLPHLSLPAALGLENNDVPIGDRYLHPSADDVIRWKTRIPQGDQLRAGVIWAGRTTPDARRSIPFASIAPLFDRRNICWYSLQVGAPMDEIPPVGNAAINNLGVELTDFAETAAAMMNLDVIVTIDTASAHLASALGRPVFLLLPWVADWRWAGDAERCHWYPSVRIFRQPAEGEWGPVIEDVARALAEISLRPSEIKGDRNV
jgi:tetratricopeptide (TPR) repeat protein